MISWVGTWRKVEFRQNLFEPAFVSFYAWSLLSLLWSIDASEALLSSQLVFLSLALFFVMSAMVREHPEFEGLFIKVQLLVLLFSFGLAFYKMAIIPYYDPYKVISVSANNNLYSGFLILSLPLVFSGFISFKRIWKYLSMMVGILCLFFIIIIQSRAAYIGTFMALSISLILLWNRYREVFKKRNILWGLFSLVFLTLLIYVFTLTLDAKRKEYFLQKARVWEYFRSYEDLQAKNIRKLREAELADHTRMAAFDFSEAYYSNANLRVIFWQKSMGLMALRPMTGVGAGNWRLAVPQIVNPPNPEHTIGNCTYSEPHNEWIRILSELGIVGFILALLVFFFPLVYVYIRIFRSAEKLPVESLFYVAFITGFYLFAAFDFPLRRVEHNILLWSIFAFMLNKVPLPILSERVEYKPKRGMMILVTGLLLFTLISGMARIRGEYYTVLMFRNERKNDSLVISYCKKAENPFYRITPNTLPLAWFEGVAHYRLGESEEASACFQRALTYTPYEVRVLNDYAAGLFKANKSLEAIDILKKTLVIDPFFDDARFNLGAIYYFSGDTKRARVQILGCRESQKKTDYLREMR
jgi:tetratricopeptide (TPR) repeat protein